jgi:hypothetical protein
MYLLVLTYLLTKCTVQEAKKKNSTSLFLQKYEVVRLD